MIQRLSEHLSPDMIVVFLPALVTALIVGLACALVSVIAVLKRLAQEPLAQEVCGPGLVRRFWAACSLPDFRQHGAETHARFVARLWQDLRHDYLGADYVAARIAELDNVQGDIDTLQGRIASIRSWAYIAQRPDWVLARDEMAARARAVEAKLSDALHARLTERFVNRRTTLLMKSLGQDASALPVTLEPDGHLTDTAGLRSHQQGTLRQPASRGLHHGHRGGLDRLGELRLSERLPV